eukprot:scaffold1924_cov92-Cylindrotheca_fusiformis.AAC.2
MYAVNYWVGAIKTWQKPTCANVMSHSRLSFWTLDSLGLEVFGTQTTEESYKSYELNEQPHFLVFTG